MRRNEEQTLFHKVQIKFREFRVLVFGPIPQGQNAELDFTEKIFREFREFRGFRVMDLAEVVWSTEKEKLVVMSKLETMIWWWT